MKRLPTILIVGLVGALAVTASAQADTYRVNRTGDPVPNACTPSHCSLREAVIEANASIGTADRIVLPNRRRAYRLTRVGSDEDGALDGDLDVTNDPLAILHRKRGKATIEASAIAERVLETFERTTLRKVVLTGGEDEDEDGGAIKAGADLRIVQSVLRGNHAVDPGGGPGLGGAIYHNSGTLTIVGSKLLNNRADDESGAIDANGDRTVIKRSTLRGNVSAGSGSGAIYNSGPVLRIDRSTFANNRAQSYGGAIYVNNGQAVITNSTFAGNQAGTDGGAILSFGTLSVTNSTFWKNRAAGDAGAIYNGLGDATLNATTVARNTSNSDGGPTAGLGGGIYNDAASEFEIANSLLAFNNEVGGDTDDCFGPFLSSGGNLRTDGTACSGFTDTGDAIRANPKIGGLRRNGGPTKTIALKQGSPAIGRAINALAPNRDQRGRRRGGNPDSGAFERGA